MPYTRGLRGSCIHYYHIYPPSIHWRYLVSNCNKGVLFSQAKTQRRLRTMSDFLSPCLGLPLWRREKSSNLNFFHSTHVPRRDSKASDAVENCIQPRMFFLLFSLSYLRYGLSGLSLRCIVSVSPRSFGICYG